MTRSRLPGEDPEALSVRLEDEQNQAFQYLGDKVLNPTRQASEIVEVLAKGAKGEADAAVKGNAKTIRKVDDEDYVPKQK
jgi:hypothetical protein